MIRIWKMGIVLALPLVAAAQQQGGTLTISGQTDQATLLRINGKSYVDIESLARITHGSVKFQGSQTILTLPGASSSAAAVTTAQPVKVPQLSGGFLNAEIEALTQIREWRAALVSAIQNNYPVTDGWVSKLRRNAEAKLQLSVAAVSTDPDQKASELLRNEFASMLQMSDGFVATHAKADYISPDSLDNNAQDEKILNCERALISMAATKQFQDDPSCH
ncbi:MAG: hypothetical protein M3O31_17255 [Acidobacteriota bacterium]|nr:hypothetical protein [Acidobacteriota bacterium]